MVINNQQQEKLQDFKDFELIKLLFQKVASAGSDPVDLLDKSFEARFQSLVDQIQSYLHSSEKVGFFPHRFLGWFSSILDTKLNDKLGIKKLHFRFEGARTLKVVVETESKAHVFIFTEDIEAQYSNPQRQQMRTRNFEFTKGEWKDVMGRDYTRSDARKLQIDVVKILKDKYELVKGRPKSKTNPTPKKLYLYLRGDGILEYVAKDIRGNTQIIQISRNELKGNYAFKARFFDEIKQFLGKSGKDLSDDVRKELSRITSAKGYTLKGGKEDEKINIEIERNKKIKDEPIAPPAEFPFKEVTKKLGESVYLEDYIEKLANPDAEIDQVQENLKEILAYIKGVHTNLNLQGNVYGIKAREADQHGFVAGVFDNFRYRDNTKVYLEQFAGGGYADIVLLVRGPNRAVDSVPILIELKAGTKGQVTPSDALKQAEDYIKGFRPNKMRILTNADNAIAVGLNLDNVEPFKTEVKPIKQPSSLMEDFIKLARRWNNQQLSEKDFKQEIADLLSSEYHTFPANKETKDHYYFSRDILGQSILINKIGQDQSNIKKYIYSYDEYPLNWPQGTEYTLSKSPVMTLILVQGNEGQEKTAFIFHIRESNTKEFYADKKIPVLNIPEIGKVGNAVEIKMSLKKYETGLSFEDLFKIEQISKYKPSGADQQFTGSFLKIPNSDELKVKFDQAITSQHATSSDGKDLLPDYKRLLTEIADAIYPIKDLITNEARLQAVLNGLLSGYSDLKLKETSAKIVIIPEFQVGAGGRVDMVIQGIGPSPQGTKEYTPIALEFKLIDKNLNQDQLKQEVDKLTKEQNVRYAKGAALKTITDSDKMFFMGVVVNVKAKDKNSLILTSDEFVPAIVVHSSIDIAKRKHLEGIQEITQRLKNIGIQEENLRTLESATAEKDYHYWLQQHDIADIARIEYGYGADTLFEIVGSPGHIVNQLQQFQDSVTTRGERRPLTLIVNLDNNHWVTLVVAYQNGQYNGYYVDSLGNSVPDNIRQVLQQAQITVNGVSVTQQRDGYNCGLWALENARGINAVLQGSRSNIPDEIRNRLQVQGRDEAYFIRTREDVSDRLSIDPQRIANLEAVLAETQAPKKKFDLNNCVKQGSRKRRSINPCLFSLDDVKKFIKGRVDENNIDKIIIDSEKFLTYVKSSQGEKKNAQLVEFVGDKSIEGDRKYLLDKVIEDQGYERYVQNERIKDLHGDISQQNSGLIKSPKLKSRLMNAAGGIQLIRGIHGAIVSCKDGTATDCGLNLGGIGWSFASQPIENVMVKITPKVVASAEKVVGKIIPGTLGKQTKFAVRIAGAKFGGTIARGTVGAIAGVFDIVEIGMSASNLVDCKKREDSDNPCGEKEIRDNIASISFSSVSFVSGVALTAASMPVVGIAVGFGLMVGYGIYSGVSNIIEYEKKYDTTHGENWSIFWRTLLFQPMAADVQHLAARKDTVNSLAKGVWQALNNGPNSVIAYGVGFGKVSDNTLRPDYAMIMMNRTNANTKNLSRVIPDYIKGATRVCLPQITNQDYEKGIKSSVKSAAYYCENAMVISHDSRVSMKQKDKTIVYDLRNVDGGNIVGNNVWNNNFLIYSGTERITGGNNVVNRFVLVDNIDFSGKMIGGNNSTNILDLSQLKDTVVGVKFNYRFKPNASGPLKAIVNNRLLINDSIDNNGIFNYYYVGRKNKVDEVLCMGYSEHFTGTDDRDVIIDSGGGSNNNEKDIVENCKKVIISPYTTVKGRKSHYTFYVKTADYKGRGLYSEIDVDGTGTVVFPEIDLLGDCDQITYSVNSNTLSLKVNFSQNNQFTLDIKNYVEKSSNKPHFVLIDKNGSNIIPKIGRSDSSTIEIKSFELHSEHPLNNFNDVENHYKKILNNHKSYKVFGVIRDKVQNQDNSTVPHMFFGSSEDDIINFDQGAIVARGGDGSDVYFISNDINSREVKIDNNSNDKKLDILFMPMVEKDFSVQQCDLHLNYNNTSIQVKNYLQDRNYRHLIIMNKKGEAFIPNIQSMSCSLSFLGKGKLVPFLQATQTQNMFLLPKDFEDDHVVIDSNLEDIQKYKDRDDLLLIRESKISFIIRIEDFYNDRSKWNNISYSLWNNNDFFPSLGLLENVDNIVEYKDKLRGDYERIIKEYIEDFSNSTSSIQHNQKLEKNIYTSVEQDEERMGVMILKNTTPGQVEVFSSGEGMIFRDKRSNHTINIKGWNNNESYRISALEFDLGLEPITIRKLDRFSLSEVRKIQDLIGKASENYQNRNKYTPRVENDFKCLISTDGFENKSKEPTYQCLGFSSLQDQINFVESVCSAEQIEEFMGKIPSNIQVLSLLIKLHNDLLLSSYDKSIIDKCNYSMITSKSEVSKLLYLVAGMNDLPGVKFLLDNGANVEIKGNNDRTLLNIVACNGNLNMTKLIYNRIEAGSNDPSKMMKLARILKEQLISQANIQSDIKEWAESRISDLRNSIKDIVVERLKDGMLNDRYTSTIELAKETYIFENKLFSDVIKEVINDVYGKVDTEKILSFIHYHDQIEQKAYGYVAVFDKMESKNNLNDNAVFKLAYYVKEIIDSEKRSDLESLKNRLPESVKNTVFLSKVCIKNVKYNEYLYAADYRSKSSLKYDDERRRVFTWITGSKDSQSMWKIEPYGDNVYIMNVKYNEYLYAADYRSKSSLKYDDERRYVFTWITGSKDSQSMWKIEPYDDNVYIMNVKYNEYLYAADYRSKSSLKYDDERRHVFTWITGSKDSQSVWRIEDCGFNMKKRDVINQSADIKARDNNGETSLHTAIQYSNAFNANVGFHSDIVRFPRQVGNDIEMSVYHIKGTEDEGGRVQAGKSQPKKPEKIPISRVKFINYLSTGGDESRRIEVDLADQVEVTGKFQGLAKKIAPSQEAISHLNKVRRVSGILMHGMMAKSALASFLNGDYQGVAINLGFITGSQGFSKVAEVASIKGLKLASEGKLLLSRSLKAASPFLARGTSAFVVYDLVNQVKAFKNGTEEALVGVIGDSIYLGVDAAEIGIEVAEAFEVLEGVSSVTGPIGATIGAVVFVGTDIYMAVKRVDKIDQIIHLKGSEKLIEGLRAFIGMQPKQYIEELMEEKQLYNQLVKQGLEYLQQHNDIQKYVFPTGKSVIDSCRNVSYQINEWNCSSPKQSTCFSLYPITRYTTKCETKFKEDLNNTVVFSEKRTDIKWSRAKPDDPKGGQLFCLPQSNYSLAPSYGSYLCKSAIGIADLSTNKTGNHTLINLGEGDDYAKGFIDSPNIFVVNDGFKKYYGGNKDDMFILQGNFIEGDINGGDGVDTVDLEEFASEVRSIQVKLGRSGYVSYNSSSFGIENINRISTRKDKSDTITCDYNTKYVDGRGGESNDNPDVITIPGNPHFHEMQLIIRPSTNIVNHASAGNFNYTTLSDKGKALVSISLQSLLSGTPTDRHNFFFNYTLSELINIDIRNISLVSYYNYTIREAVFSFSLPLSQNKSINEKFNVTISDIPANASYVLSDNTEIKIGKNNLYAIHNTNKTIDEIVKSYPAVADHLRMSLFVNTNNETVVIGHGNHDVISNNFLQRSHLIGSGGENIYVITSGYEILDIESLPIPEVIVYDDFNKKESLKDTLDLRQLVQQVNSDLSIEPISNVIKDEDDILIKLSISATGLQQDVATVRLKDAFANNWYKELQIILNNVPVKIDDDLDLKPLPLTFNEEIVIVTPKDVEGKDKLIISKKAEQYTFLHSGYDLIITNAFNADIETNKLCTIYLKDFYKESKMETLSIKFTDKEILLNNEMDKINNADSILDITNYNIKLSDLNKKLLTAAQDCNFNKVRDLVNQNADVNAQDSNKRTSLHRAALKGCLDVVEFLEEEGAEIDIKDNINRTALHLAARKCHSSVVQSFVKKGANVNARDKDGKTPLDLASWQKQLDITSGQDCDQTIEHLGKSNQEGGNHVQRRRRHHHGDYNRHHNHLSRNPLAIDSSNQHEITASSGARPSSWINDLCGWAKEKGGKLASDLVNGLYRGTAKELKDSKLTDIQMDSSNQWKSKQPSYDQAQEVEFQYMSKYDARKGNDKNAGAYSKKRGNDRQAKQQYESKINNKQSVISGSVNQSKIISNEKQQKSGVLHNKSKPTLSYNGNKNHSYFDDRSKKISERKEHIVNHKQFDNSSYKHSNQHKPMISANNKWSEKISNERIDSRKMIGGANQKQQGFHQNQQSSHNSKHAHLTRATVQVDVPSTLFALNMLAMKATNQKFNNTPLPKKIQKGMLHAEKVRAETLGRKVGGRIEGTLWFTK